MVCSKCGSPLPQGKYFCPKCGKEIQLVPIYDEEDDFEADLNEKEGKSSPAEKKQGFHLSRKIVTALVISFITVGVLTAAWLVIQRAVAYRREREQYNSFAYQQEQAITAVRNKEYDLALSFYQRALELERYNLEVRFNMADIYRICGEEEAACGMYREILKYEPQNQSAYEALIAVYDAKGDYASILELGSAVNDEALKELFAPYRTFDVTFSEASGTYPYEIEVALTTDEGDILYTTDGCDPKESGLVYDLPIPIRNGNTTVIRAVCRNQKGMFGPENTETYSVEIPAPDMPVVSPESGDFASPAYIYIDMPVYCDAYYTWDGSDPDADSSHYDGTLLIPEGNHVFSVVLYDMRTGLYSPVFRTHYTYYEPIEESIDEEAEDEE